MAKVEIRNRWSAEVIFSAEIPDEVPEQFRLLAAVRLAVKSNSDLSGSDLSGSDLTPIRDDFWAVLSAAPKEAEGLRQALIAGRVDGSHYEGECACLVGTIANVRGVHHEELGALRPNASRPSELFFLGISKGDTPATSQHAQIALEWTEEWIKNMREAFGAQPRGEGHE